MAIRLPAIMQVFKVDTTDLERAEAEFGRAGGGIGQSIAAGAAIGGAALVGLGAVGVGAASGVETGLAEVVTLTGKTGDAARDAMGEFATGVRGVSDEFGVAQDELTGGLYSALSAGVPQDNVFDFMEVATKASVAGVTDVETSVDGISSTINAFGLEAGEAGAVADSMFAAVQGGKTTFEELSASLFNVAPAAAAAGVKFSDVNAGLAALTASGVPTSVATTQLRAAMVALQKPSDEMTAIFQDLGYENAQTAIEAEGLQFALDAVGTAADGDNGKLQTLLGSVEAVGAVQTLTGTASEKFTAELERQENATGSVDDAYSTMADTTEQTWARLKTGLMNGLIAFGQQALPLVNDAMDGFTAALGWAQQNASWLVPTLATIGAIIATALLPPLLVYIAQLGVAAVASTVSAAKQYAASLRTVAGWVAQGAAATVNVAKVVAGWVAAGAGAVAGAARQAASAARVVGGWVLMGVQSLAQAARMAAAWVIAMGPVGWVIAAVVALVALIIANWDTIVEATKAAWEWVTEKISAAWRWVTDTTSKAVAAVVGFFTNLRDQAVARVTALRDRVVGFFTGIRDRVIEAAGRLAAQAILKFLELKDGAIEKARELLTYVTGLPGELVSAIGDLGSLLVDKGKDVVRGLWDGIKGMGSWLADKVTGWAASVIPGPIASALGISSPSRVARDLMREVPRGAALGIEDGTRDVERAAQRMAEAAEEGAVARARRTLGGAGAQVDNSRRYDLNVTGSPVAVDEAELMRMLRRAEVLDGALAGTGLGG